MSDVLHERVSACGRFKMEVRLRPDGLYDVTCWRWAEDLDGSGKKIGFWSQQTGPEHPVVLTDSLSTACQLAGEELARLSR